MSCTIELEYDKEVFEMCKGYLHLRDGYKGPICLPKGLKSCRRMFSFADLSDCTLEGFDTSEVIDMSGMFQMCYIPKGFTLGENFNTENVMSMSEMFDRCMIPPGFSLGDKFVTRNVKSMHMMFYECHFPEDFQLGRNFNVKGVHQTSYMFRRAKRGDTALLGSPKDIVELLKIR